MHIAVQVIPWAKTESVAIIGTNIYGHTVYKIKTTQKPKNNEANIAVHKILAKYLGVPLRNVELIWWHTWRDKLFHIKDIP
jgi:uncharacterized protein YggU (UPF0235/DUF167 family)